MLMDLPSILAAALPRGFGAFWAWSIEQAKTTTNKPHMRAFIHFSISQKGGSDAPTLHCPLQALRIAAWDIEEAPAADHTASAIQRPPTRLLCRNAASIETKNSWAIRFSQGAAG